MKHKLMPTATAVLLALSTVGPAHAAEISVAREAIEKWSAELEIERPWRDLTNLPDAHRRQRGAMAYVHHNLINNRIPKEPLANLYRDLERLLALKNSDQVLKIQPAFRDYQKFFKIDVFRLWQNLLTKSATPIRWNSSLSEAYFSQADGAGILFDVRLPPAVKDLKVSPMLVVLNGGPRVAPSADFPFIQIRPSRGRIWGYRSISGYDVMQAIAFMKRHYPVDPNRIYLVGSSAGASGAMHLASCHPDEFAAVLPLVAAGNNYPLANFKNLPVAIHHGTEDWTSSICNARVQNQKMLKLDCPVILKEYPRAGHNVPKPHEPLVKWLFTQTRNQSPASITHECETPALGRSYWIRIREFKEPHQRAFVAASVNPASGKGTALIRPTNVLAFMLNLKLIPGGVTGIKTVEIEGTRFAVSSATDRIEYRYQNDRWQVATEADSDNLSTRPYHAGAAANLYQGEPLLIVYGTGNGQKSLATQLRSAAVKLAAFGGPTHTPMQNRFPIVADIDLSPDQAANCNLILIGTPDENSATKAILPGLPITIKNETLIAGNRPALPLKNQILSLLHPHPSHPKCLVYLIAPFTDKPGLSRFCKATQQFLVGSEGFDRISQADLVVQNLDHRIARQMQFGSQWEWIHLSGSDSPIPARFNDRAHLATAHLKIMRRKSAADFALWWGPEDKGMWGYDFNFLSRHNPEFYTMADFRTQHSLLETMTGGVSGLEMKEIWKRWVKTGQLLSVSELPIESLEDERQYRVHIPMDLYIKLGQRRKNLNNPQAGPTISSEEVMAEVFRQ